MAEKYYIYILQNIINNKIYIGQTQNIKQRYYGHISDIKIDKNGHLYNSIRKYGFNNFRFEIIEEWFSRQDIDDAEVFWIQYFNTRNRNIGYNKAEGGRVNRGMKRTEAQKKHLSEMNRGKRSSPRTEFKKGLIPWIKGKHLSESMKKHLSEIHKGKHYSPCTEFKKGHKISEETRQKISLFHKTHSNSGQFKKGHQLNKKKLIGTEEIVKNKYISGEYSLTQLAKEYKMSRGPIKRILLENNIIIDSNRKRKINISQNQINQIIYLREKEFTLNKISRETKLSISIVFKILKKHNIKLPPKIKVKKERKSRSKSFSQDQVNTIINLSEHGYSINKIAKELKYCKNRIKKLLEENNINITINDSKFKKGHIPANKILTDQNEQEIVLKYKSGDSQRKLAKDYNIDRTCIRRVLLKFDILKK